MELNRRPAPARRWIVHALCLVWIGLVFGVGLARAPRDADLRRGVFEGSTPERVFALLALSQRAPQEIDPDLVQALLADPDPRMREAPFTNLVSRHLGKAALAPLAERLPARGERWRALFWLGRDVASSARMTRAELRAYYDLPPDAPRTP